MTTRSTKKYVLPRNDSLSIATIGGGIIVSSNIIVDANNNLSCDAIISEQFDNGHFLWAHNLWSKRTERIIIFTRHEYERLGVFRIKIRSLVHKSVNFSTVPIWLHHTVALLKTLNQTRIKDNMTIRHWNAISTQSMWQFLLNIKRKFINLLAKYYCLSKFIYDFREILHIQSRKCPQYSEEKKYKCLKMKSFHTYFCLVKNWK